MTAEEHPAAPFAFSALTPTAFLERSARVFADREAVRDGDRTFTYADLRRRALALTGALARWGVRPGDRVAALCANSHVMLELHLGVPLRGAVLVPLNIRLSTPELVALLRHCGAGVLVATHELAGPAAEVARAAGVRLVLGGAPGDEYEEALAGAEPAPVACTDERALMSINYTSGTTGGPKGVMYHHRGAYLQSLAMAYHARLGPDSRYLWTLPMFHCHGWCFPWAVLAAGGTQVCLRSIDVAAIWDHLGGTVTHFSAAPTVLRMLAQGYDARRHRLPAEVVQVQTGGAPPSPTLLAELEALRMTVTHLYGLTETFGPVAVNVWRRDWDGLAPARRADLLARQGVANIAALPLRVVDPAGRDVPTDGDALGEIVVRGNDVMLGYYRDPEATERATLDGWFRTGDLAVMHDDGYVEVRDRAKDIIISGGENIASVEVERVLEAHPAVSEAAVVAAPDERWGQVPVAYVELAAGARVDAPELVAFARERLAGFKVPKTVVFTDLPRTATGKIHKASLRSGAPAAGYDR